MSKNPFVPPPSYSQQPPLPPGPPPPPQASQDYSAYWAAAAAVQNVQTPAVAAYTSQWTPPQPPAQPSPEHSALYANYGYGGQHNWQRQNAPQPQQHYQPSQPPPPPAPLAQAPPTQPAYNPYQPYVQPYVPQATAQPMSSQAPYHHPPPQQPQPQPQFFPQHHQTPMQHQPRHNVHHTPQNHLPPAKRQRFDGPSYHNQNQTRHSPLPPQPQFQPPPPPPQRPSGSFGPRPSGPSQSGGSSFTQIPLATPMNRGGATGGRGSPGGRGGRGGRGKVPNIYPGPARGGGPSGGSGGIGGSMRGHAPRGNFANKELHNRRGGSFNASNGSGTYPHHSQNASYRNRNQGHQSSGRGSRQDGSSTSGARDGPMNSSAGASGKKDENRRTLTDFKLVALEILELNWSWGVLPSPVPPSPVKTETDETTVIPDALQVTTKPEPTEPDVAIGATGVGNGPTVNASETTSGRELKAVPTEVVIHSSSPDTSSGSFNSPPPSRVRIYFHTPVSPDDSHLPYNYSSGSGHVLPDARKGKRKKLEDDDGDLEVSVTATGQPQSEAAATSELAVTATGQPQSEAAATSELAVTVTGQEQDEAAVPHEVDITEAGEVAVLCETSTEVGTEVGEEAELVVTEIKHGDDDSPVEPGCGEPASSAGSVDTPSLPVKAEKASKTPSANRLSISYAGGSRRLVVDAEVIDTLTVFRAESRIEVIMNLGESDNNGFKGIYVEGLSEVSKFYLPLQALPDFSETDDTVPPFGRATLPAKITMTVHLDKERPLSEPRWVKTGDVQEWLRSMFGRMFWVAGDAAQESWEKKIEVKDPDPAPTIRTILDGWAANSNVGHQTDRQRFVKTHMTEPEHILEILLRLVRGDRATTFAQPASYGSSSLGPLLSSRSSPYSTQQTHVSLAVLAIFRMTTEYATKALGDKGQVEVEERVGEVIRCLPTVLIHRSLDGMFKEWKADKKGR